MLLRSCTDLTAASQQVDRAKWTVSLEKKGRDGKTTDIDEWRSWPWMGLSGSADEKAQKKNEEK